jgi:hypothetical protein
MFMCVAGCRIQDPTVHPVCAGIREDSCWQSAEVSSHAAVAAITSGQQIQQKQNHVHTVINGVLRKSCTCYRTYSKNWTPNSITEKELCTHSSQKCSLQELISRLPWNPKEHYCLQTIFKLVLLILTYWLGRNIFLIQTMRLMNPPLSETASPFKPKRWPE